MIDFNALMELATALFAALSSAILAYLAYLLSRQSERSQTYRSTSEAYDRLIRFRVEHPEVMNLSHRWTPACWDYLYRQSDETDRKWAIYYTYVELAIGFINAVLYARSQKLLDRKVFEAEYGMLMKYLMTENYPIISSMLESGKYVSTYVRVYWQELKELAWNFEANHKAMIGSSVVSVSAPDMGG